MSAARRRGTAWESNIVAFLQRSGWPHAERRALAGSLDKGDLTGVPGLVVEAKAEQRIALAQYVGEVAVEKANAKADVGVAWIKRPKKADAGDGYVVMDGHQFVALLKAAGF